MHNDDMSSYVTRDELVGRFAPLAEMRTMLREDIARLHAGQAALAALVTDTRDEVVGLQREANGRTTKNEASVIAAHDQLAALMQRVVCMHTTVTSIKADGCDQKRTHLEVLSAIRAAGLVPDTGEWLDRPERPTWTRREKVAAVAGGIGVGGLGIGVLLPHVGPALHWLVHLLTGAPLP